MGRLLPIVASPAEQMTCYIFPDLPTPIGASLEALWGIGGQDNFAAVRKRAGTTGG
jgi:hypothetical protein